MFDAQFGYLMSNVIFQLNLKTLLLSDIRWCEPFYLFWYEESAREFDPSTEWHKKRELLKTPTKIEKIQEKNLLTEIEPLKLAF